MELILKPTLDKKVRGFITSYVTIEVFMTLRLSCYCTGSEQSLNFGGSIVFEDDAGKESYIFLSHIPTANAYSSIPVSRGYDTPLPPVIRHR